MAVTECGRCGTLLVEKAGFCHRCGTPVVGVGASLDLGTLRVETPGVAGTGGRRWPVVVMVGAVVTVLAVALSVGGEGESAEPTPTTTTSPRTTTTRPVATTTGAPAGEVVVGSAVAAPVIGRATGFSLVLASNTGDVMFVDLDSGAVSTIDTGQSIDGLLGFGDRVAAVSGQRGQLWRVTASGLGPNVFEPSTRINLLAGSLYPGDDESFFAAVTDQRTGALQRVVRMAWDGSGEIESFAVPPDVFPRGITPSGGLVVGSLGGGTYLIEPGGEARRIADGFPMAALPDRVLVSQCGDVLDCGTVVVDLDTGEVTPVADGLDLDMTRSQIEFAPGGAAVLHVLFVDEPVPLVVPLDGSPSCELAAGSPSFQAFGTGGWAPDGTFIVTTARGADVTRSLVTLTEIVGCRAVGLELPFAYRGSVSVAVVETAGLASEPAT